MANTVKTWRVTKDQLRVGDSSRLFGELIPEADSWPPHTQGAYERAGAIEKVFISQEEFDEFKKKHSTATSPAVDGKKKRIVKKSVAKKRVVKKKEKTSGGRREDEGSGSAREVDEAGREEGSKEGSVLQEESV